MKKSSYMTRAMKSQDPRFARILSGLGYARSDMVAAEPSEPCKPFAGKGDHDNDGKTGGSPKQGEDMADLRKRYQEVLGKRAFPGWDAATLLAKIAAKG